MSDTSAPSIILPLTSEDLPRGYKASGLACGIKSSGKPDFSLVVSVKPAAAAAVFTTNKVCAAPVQLSRKHLQARAGQIRGVIVTSGNANAATGAAGLAVAYSACNAVAQGLDVDPTSLLIGQTGLIGIPLKEEIVTGGATQATKALSETPTGWEAAASGMMTTDNYPKWACARCTIDGKEVRVLGLAKGVAMAHPAMATIIVSVFTDAQVDSGVLDGLLRTTVNQSFHALSIDGCQSTNDTVFLLANGAAGNSMITSADSSDAKLLGVALDRVTRQLALNMARDAEGAHKLIHCIVEEAESQAEAYTIARKVVGSVLVKCAIAGECAYWGRVIAEVGASGASVNPEKISIAFGDTIVCKDGMACPHDQAKATQYMRGNTITITVRMGLGGGTGDAFGCDLTHEYLTINMEKS